MSAMAEMSKAIRETIEEYAPTLAGLPDYVLHDFAQIVSAFAADLRDEQSRRAAR